MISVDKLVEQLLMVHTKPGNLERTLCKDFEVRRFVDAKNKLELMVKVSIGTDAKINMFSAEL